MNTALHFSRWGHLLVAISLVGFLASAQSASAEELQRPKKKRQSVSAQAATPMRVIVTANLPRDPAALPAWRGRQPMALDASGTPREPDEPRFVTGSYVKQRFDIYGGRATTAYNLQIAGQDDLRTGAGFLHAVNAGNFGASGGSASDVLKRISQERYVLDLRRIPAARRLTVATQLLGPVRGQQLVAEFEHWQVIHGIN